MKKILTLLHALTILLTLCACSSETEPTEPQSTEPEGPPPITFKETVVIDCDTCAIKITDIKPEDTFGYSLSVHLVNKTAVKQTFAVIAASTNGVANDPFFAADVDAGKSANQAITFSDTELENRIGPYTDIFLHFRVYDSDDWFSEPVAETSVHVYPYGEENATTYTRVSQATDTVLVDNEKVTAIVTHCKMDKEGGGYTAYLYLVNKTDTKAMFTTYDVSLNGLMIDPYYADEVPGGCCAFSKITWSTASLNEHGITQVDSITMTLRAYDYEDWLSDDYVKETFTLNP